MFLQKLTGVLAPVLAGLISSRGNPRVALPGAGFPAPNSNAAMGGSGFVSGAATAYATNALLRRFTRSRSPLVAAGANIIAPLVVAKLASSLFASKARRSR